MVAAIAIPASAATITYGGEFGAKFTHSFSGTEVFNPVTLAEGAYLKLNLTFKEGDKAVAYLPLTLEPFAPAAAVKVGNWYAAFNSAPVSFWASNNNTYNAYKFASMGDPLGIAAKLSSSLVFNANGSVLGAKYNVYAADLGSFDKVVVITPEIPAVEDDPATPEDETAAAVPAVTETVTLQKGNAFLGRVTYGLPMDFTLGVIGAYTNGIQLAESDGTTAVISEDSDYLTLGVDVVGKIPGFGAKLTAAIADSIEKEVGGTYYTSTDHLAFQLKLEEINVGPVAAWAKFTGVGTEFYRNYAGTSTSATLNKYYGATAIELEGVVDIPVGIPVQLTLGNGLWFEYPFVLDYNETYAEAVIEPLADLVITVDGAYAADLNGDDDGGWRVGGDVAYTVVGLTINPYIDYLVGRYVESDPTHDFVVGLGVEGSPVQGLTLEADANFTIEEKALAAYLYAKYVTEFNPGFVKSAKTTVAALVEYDHTFVTPTTAAIAGLDYHVFAGSEVGINDKLNATIGALVNDSASDIAASGKLNYTASDTIATNLILTYRQDAVGGYAGWMPFEFDDIYFEANVTSTIGKSTFKVAYGDDGLESAPTEGTHSGKPWSYLFNKPEAAMPWDKLSFTISVPF